MMNKNETTILQNKVNTITYAKTKYHFETRHQQTTDDVKQSLAKAIEMTASIIKIASINYIEQVQMTLGAIK